MTYVSLVENDEMKLKRISCLSVTRPLSTPLWSKWWWWM